MLSASTTPVTPVRSDDAHADDGRLVARGNIMSGMGPASCWVAHKRLESWARAAKERALGTTSPKHKDNGSNSNSSNNSLEAVSHIVYVSVMAVCAVRLRRARESIVNHGALAFWKLSPGPLCFDGVVDVFFFGSWLPLPLTSPDLPQERSIFYCSPCLTFQCGSRVLYHLDLLASCFARLRETP